MTTLQVIKGGDNPPDIGLADYVWVDQQSQLRCKKRAVQVPQGDDGPVFLAPPWTYTEESGEACILSPCFFVPDPLRPAPSFITVCEVRDLQDRRTFWNARGNLVQCIRGNMHVRHLLVGYRQPYRLLGDEAQRSVVAERHLGACLDAGLLIHSAVVTLDESEFKIGPRGFNDEIDQSPSDPVVAADHMMLARHLLVKVALDYGLRAEFTSFSMFVSTQRLRMELDQTALDQLCQVVARLQPEGSAPPRPVLDAVRRGFVCVEFSPAQGADPYAAGWSLLKSM